MIITLSPTKIMSFEQQPDLKFTEPIFKRERDEIIALLRNLSVDEIKKLMSINQEQADVVLPQIHQFGKKNGLVSASAFAYNGIAFKGLDFPTLSPENMVYAQQHLLIESAIYGFLRPLDKVYPYRLEMQAKLKNSKGKTLYNYWQETLTNYLSKRLSQDDKIWLNLSSEEYAKVINSKVLPSKSRIITPQFKEESANGYRQVVVHTKKARGMMARFVIENKIRNIEDLKAFDTEGYCYAEHLSSESEPMFIR
jgi:uncharacterized protein